MAGLAAKVIHIIQESSALNVESLSLQPHYANVPLADILQMIRAILQSSVRSVENRSKLDDLIEWRLYE